MWSTHAVKHDRTVAEWLCTYRASFALSWSAPAGAALLSACGHGAAVVQAQSPAVPPARDHASGTHDSSLVAGQGAGRPPPRRPGSSSRTSATCCGIALGPGDTFYPLPPAVQGDVPQGRGRERVDHRPASPTSCTGTKAYNLSHGRRDTERRQSCSSTTRFVCRTTPIITTSGGGFNGRGAATTAHRQFPRRDGRRAEQHLFASKVASSSATADSCASPS